MTGSTPTFSRRGFLRASAAGGAAAVGLQVHSPVQRADAIACGGICIGATAAAGGVAAGWLLRETEVLGSDDPPEGMTPDALRDSAYKAARTRKSNNKSTFVDNRNIIDTGYRNALYADGKVASIEALNDQLSESEVQSAAANAAEAYASTVEKNYLKSWNESVRELKNLISSAGSHPDLSEGAIATAIFVNGDEYPTSPPNFGTRDVTLSDGSAFTVETIFYDGSGSSPGNATGNIESTGDDMFIRIDGGGSGTVEYLNPNEWGPVWNKITTATDDVLTGLSTWVSNVYGQVQAGELDTSELLTPAELAEISGEKDGVAQAIADLQALNIPIDLEREAEIHIQEQDTTLYGTLAVTSEPSGGVSAGDTINPANRDEDYYLTYDLSEASGNWSAYATGVDGGTVTFTSDPFQSALYQINTTAGETAEVQASDFSAVDGAEEWTVDISEQVETAITDIDSVKFFSTVSETEWVTVQLDSTFDVVTFTNSEGTEVDSADFSQSTPQDDTNYITQEEWQQMQERNQELIDKYEDAKSGGGGGLLPDGYNLLGMGGVGTIAAGAGGLLAFDRLSGN